MPQSRQRWTAETKVIWSLIGIVGCLLCILGSLLWEQVEKNTRDIQELNRFFNRTDVQLNEMIRRLKIIETKIDRNGGRHEQK
tara:strand:- start:5832 stop:6080 length:249 start_codon:yes stop_codon:yes gene_type:complete